ncbi:cell division protein FtsZ, partial [Vibrio parahaemolyticus VP2007-007]
STSTLQTYVQ